VLHRNGTTFCSDIALHFRLAASRYGPHQTETE